MDDLKQQMQENFLRYASYVILDRAIPHVIDGLKPVQRRILYTLHRMDDGKLHKVANVVGQTMAFHPHGDGPIQDALVNLANKNYLLDKQGNFGNLYTGDPSSAARYIETRLSKLARETTFNSDLTEFIPSYDGRNNEPVTLPVKIPLLLMQGAEGIAVGMATKILPHNFNELIEASIAILEGKEFEVLPDFPTGGIMDASLYDGGNGKIKLRAKISIPDDKTLVINDICFGTTTESLIQSIDDAAKKGKIKIESIHDFTAERVEIQIKLPRGQHANQFLDTLYAFTECEVALHSQILVIKDNLPWETDVIQILHLYVENLQGYLRQELEIERNKLLEKVFQKTLEQIFIEERMYKKIEEVAAYKEIHTVVAKQIEPFHAKLPRIPTHEDREKLLNIPIRRISRFDINKHKLELEEIAKQIAHIEKELKQIKKVTIRYLDGLLTKYGKDFPRKTEIQRIAEIDKRAITTKKVKIGIDNANGFYGLKVTGDDFLEATNFDKILVFFKDGTYKVTNTPDKEFFHKGSLIYLGIADKKTVLTVVFRDKKKIAYAKRFVVSKFILDKVYSCFDDSFHLDYFTQDHPQELSLEFKPGKKGEAPKKKIKLVDIPIKAASTKGIKLANQEVKKVNVLK
ncbi:MAG: DNA topoisomerase IV subunit A [Parachlamydiales bacterium]|nr:DNA topoisomerase IV subunit A [Parachlamydiales bacterium]